MANDPKALELIEELHKINLQLDPLIYHNPEYSFILDHLRYDIGYASAQIRLKRGDRKEFVLGSIRRIFNRITVMVEECKRISEEQLNFKCDSDIIEVKLIAKNVLEKIERQIHE